MTDNVKKFFDYTIKECYINDYYKFDLFNHPYTTFSQGDITILFDEQATTYWTSALQSIRKKYPPSKITNSEISERRNNYIVKIIENNRLVTKVKSKSSSPFKNKEENSVKNDLCKNSFLEEIDNYIKNTHHIILPNISIHLDNCKKLSFNDVRIIRSDLINYILNKKNNLKIKKNNIPLRNDGIYYNFYYIIKVTSSRETVKRNAIIKINIFNSLLRLFLLFKSDPDNEVKTFCLREGLVEAVDDDKAITINRMFFCNEHFSKIATQYPYPINLKKKKDLYNNGFFEILEKLLKDNEESVAERLSRSLDWMTRARMAEDTSERFLFFFTAIEAMLTSGDKNAPITDTIARHTATILCNDIMRERIEIFTEIKNLYSMRSEIVHRGVKETLYEECNKLQRICEMLTWEIINHCIDLNFPKFQDSLKEASFGTNWSPSQYTNHI